MTRLPIVAGNWKMNTTLKEAQDLLRALRAELDDITGVEIVVCPPFPFLTLAAQELGSSPVQVGAQNAHWERQGAYTGEVSPWMLADLCRYVILGHSERRAYFGESDEIVNRKLQAALLAELRPILCVGETLEQREAGRSDEVLVRQLRGALREGSQTRAGWVQKDVEAPPYLVVAYEPVWAIGTGVPASGPLANKACALIRRELAALAGGETAQAIRIQYGGSVTAQNIAEFAAQPEIDGALVGGASLKVDSFAAIVRSFAHAKASAS